MRQWIPTVATLAALFFMASCHDLTRPLRDLGGDASSNDDAESRDSLHLVDGVGQQDTDPPPDVTLLVDIKPPVDIKVPVDIKTTPDIKPPPDQKTPLDQAPPPDLVQPDLLAPDTVPHPDASLCGNGKLNPGEQCDGKEMGGKSCASVGKTGGTLACQKGCTLDLTGCYTLSKEVALTTGGAAQSYPSVGWAGAHYMVAWRKSTSIASQHLIQGVQVTSSGALMSKVPLPIGPTPAYSSPPHLAFDGTRSLVVWVGGAWPNNKVVGAFVDGAGKVTSSGNVSMAKTSGATWSARVASDGSQHMVFWDYIVNPLLSHGFDLYAARINKSGTLLNTAGDIKVSTAKYNQRSASAACSGSSCLVVWMDKRSGQARIYGARLNASGTLLDKNGFLISGATAILPQHSQVAPWVAWDGNTYLVVWQDDRAGNKDIYGKRVDSVGKVLDGNGLVICEDKGTQEQPRVASTGKKFVVLWQDKRGSSYDIYGTRLSPSGTLVGAGDFAFSTAAGDQSAPAVECSAAECFVAWQDLRASPQAIYGLVLKP